MMQSNQMITDLNQIKSIFKQLEKEQFICLGLNISGNWLICSISWQTNTRIIQIDSSVKPIFNEFLSGYNGQIAFWNSKEEYKIFKTQDLNFPKNILDIGLAAYLEDSERKIDLQGLVKSKFEIDITVDTVEAETSEDIFGDSPQINVDNLAAASNVIYKLTEYYKGGFDPQINKLWIEIESPLAPVLAKMELAGVFINKAKLRETGTELSQKANELEKEIFEILGSGKINLNSPAQLADALAKKGFNLNKKGASGKLSVDKAVLDSLLEQDETGLITKILEYRSLTKLLSTYTENLIALLDSNDRLHCQFNQAQAATGRISSNSPNLQNIPIRNQEYGGQIRSCFAVPEGRIMISADYSQIELRLLAHYTNDPVLKEAFELNQDIHRRTAAEIFELPLDQVTSEQRSLGKTLNFALLYQQGSFATSRQLGISTSEAKKFMEKYFSAFSCVKPFIDDVLTKARETGYTESLSGRRRYFKHLNSSHKILMREDERAAFNMVLQGSNADLIKIAMIEIDKQITEQKLDAVMMLQVHDELVFEVSREDAQTLSELIQRVMSNPPIKLNVPILVDAKMGKNWAEC